jgi:hypothetical protein
MKLIGALRLRRKRSVYERADVLGPLPGARRERLDPFMVSLLRAGIGETKTTGTRRSGVRFK